MTCMQCLCIGALLPDHVYHHHLLRAAGNLGLGNSSGSFKNATLLCAACALFGILKSACSFSVGLRTLQPISKKYWDILTNISGVLTRIDCMKVLLLVFQSQILAKIMCVRSPVVNIQTDGRHVCHEIVHVPFVQFTAIISAFIP